MVLKVLTGYKLYTSSSMSTPEVKGYSGDNLMEWTVLEGAVAGLSASAIALVTVLAGF